MLLKGSRMRRRIVPLVLLASFAATCPGPGAAPGPTSSAMHRPLPASPPAYGVAMEEAWIPMADGVRLAADIWRPTASAAGGQGDGGAKGRFPVLLEYLPYRKTEARRERYPLYAYFVRRGYVVARVDIRGTG